MVDSSVKDLSIKDVFSDLPSIRRISGDVPTQDMAVLRVLLVIFWRALHTLPTLQPTSPQGRKDWWFTQYLEPEEDQYQDQVATYLRTVHHRFDLFDSQFPFMQVPDLQTPRDSYNSIEKLIPDVESDYFTMRAGTGLKMITPAEAARWLISLHAWDYAGIKPGVIGDARVKSGKSYSIGTGWSGQTGGVVLHGKNLHETLILNTNPDVVFGSDIYQDLPVWERDQDRPGTTGREFPVGPCELLTWQSRRVRLFEHEGMVTGVLATNGDKVISDNQFHDPMTAYRYNQTASKKGQLVFTPKAHSSSRTMWRGIEPLLIRKNVEDGDSTKIDRQPATIQWLRNFDQEFRRYYRGHVQPIIGVELIGMTYGTNNSIIQNTIHEELPLQLAVLANEEPISVRYIVSTARVTQEIAGDLGRFAGDLLDAAGGEYSFNRAVADRLLNTLSDPFKSWLRNFDTTEDPEVLQTTWKKYLRSVTMDHASQLVRGAGQQALIGYEDDNGYLKSAGSLWASLVARITKKLGLESKVTTSESHTPLERTS